MNKLNETMNRRKKVEDLLRKNPEASADEIGKVYGGVLNTSHLATMRRAARAGISGYYQYSQKELAKQLGPTEGAVLPLKPSPAKTGPLAKDELGIEKVLKALAPLLLNSGIAKLTVVPNGTTLSFTISRMEVVEHTGKFSLADEGERSA